MINGGPMRARNSSTAARPPLTNYYRGEARTTSPFQKKKPPRKIKTLLIKALNVALVGAILLCLVYSLIVKPDPKVLATTEIYHPSATYQQVAIDELNSFKNRTKLTFDESALVDRLRNQFPEIDKVEIELPLFSQRPVIRISIADPKFLLASQANKYVVSSSGVVVAQAMNFADDDDLPSVIDDSGFDAGIGKVVLSSHQVAFINQVVEQCRRANIEISSLVLPSKVQELDLKTKDKKYYVKFYLAGDPMVQIGQFLAARHQFKLDHKEPKQYLDVRVAGKIFYK
jgi:hypothetical protein